MTFYTYIHIRKDNGKVFYVGKGKGGRAFNRTDRGQHWRNVAAKHGLVVEIAARWSTEDEALQHEILLIACFRSMGHPLVNMTSGGEGHAGLSPSQATRRKLSARLSEFNSAEVRLQKSRSTVDRWRDDAYRERHSAANRAIFEDEAVRQKFSEATARRWRDPAYREKMNEVSRSWWSNPDNRRLAGRALSATLASEEERRKRSERSRALMALPGAKEARRKAVRCIDTGVVYCSQLEAAVATGASQGTISAVCRGRSKTANGLRFEFVTPSASTTPSPTP